MGLGKIFFLVFLATKAVLSLDNHHEQQQIMKSQGKATSLIVVNPCIFANLDDRKGRELPFNVVHEALQLATLSRRAYVKCSDLPNELPSTHTLISCIYNSATDTEGFIAEGADGSVVVSFRGSESENLNNVVKDWIQTNFLGTIVNMSVKGKLCRPLFSACAHGGFVTAVNSVYDQVVQELEPYIEGGRKIYITGTSLGGAVATLFTYKLSKDYKQYRPNFNMFVFACPPVRNMRFIDKFNKLGIRSYDITIVGDEISYVRCSIPLLMNARLFHRPKNVYYLPGKGGHQIVQYIAQLEGIQTEENYLKKYQL